MKCKKLIAAVMAVAVTVSMAIPAASQFAPVVMAAENETVQSEELTVEEALTSALQYKPDYDYSCSRELVGALGVYYINMAYASDDDYTLENANRDLGTFICAIGLANWFSAPMQITYDGETYTWRSGPYESGVITSWFGDNDEFLIDSIYDATEKPSFSVLNFTVGSGDEAQSAVVVIHQLSVNFDKYKETKINTVNDMLKSYDGSKAKKKINQAVKDIEAYTFDNSLTLSENYAEITTIISTLRSDLKTIRKTYPASVSLSKTSFVYNGKVRTPYVTVLDKNGATVAASKYTVKISGKHKTVGKYTVTVTFKDSYYSGSKTATFTIKPKSTKISKLTAANSAFKVKIAKQTAQTTGYQIQYARNSKFLGATTLKVKNTTTVKTINNLISGKKYYVRVRTYKTVNGTTYYSSWSAAKSVTTK